MKTTTIDKLEHLMRAKHVVQKKLAIQIGLSETTFMNRRREGMQKFTLEQLENMCNILGVSLDVLLDKDEPENEPENKPENEPEDKHKEYVKKEDFDRLARLYELAVRQIETIIQ